MNFDQPIKSNDFQKEPIIKTSEKLGNLNLENIEVDRNFEEHKELSEEVKQKFSDKNVFPIKERYFPDSFFRGMADLNIETHKNQLSSFKKYVDNSVSKKNNFKLLVRILLGKNNQPDGFGGNWFGYTMFTTPNDDPGIHISYIKTGSDWTKPGYVSEFGLKKVNPIVIKKTEVYKITGIIPKNKEELESSERILKEYCVDGILYESDGNAVAWLNPDDILELRKIIKNEFVNEDNRTKFQKTVVYEADKK